MKTFLIPADLLQALFGYLQQRPYGEVAPAIAALQQLQPAPEPQPEPAEDLHPLAAD